MDRQNLRSAVSAMVNSEDPEVLLAMGAPQDEYSPEINDLVCLVTSGGFTEDTVLALWESWSYAGCGLFRTPPPSPGSPRHSAQ